MRGGGVPTRGGACHSDKFTVDLEPLYFSGSEQHTGFPPNPAAFRKGRCQLLVDATPSHICRGSSSHPAVAIRCTYCCTGGATITVAHRYPRERMIHATTAHKVRVDNMVCGLLAWIIMMIGPGTAGCSHDPTCCFTCNILCGSHRPSGQTTILVRISPSIVFCVAIPRF